MKDIIASLGEAQKLFTTLEIAGYTMEDIRRLCDYWGLEDLKTVIRKGTEIIAKPHIIDCDVEPFVPKYLKLKEHIKGGQIDWDFSKFELYIVSEQRRNEGRITARELYEKFKGNSAIMNACVLGDLLKNKHLIPLVCERKAVLFYHSLYEHEEDKTEYILSLSHNPEKKKFSMEWIRLDSRLGSNFPAAVFNLLD